MSYDFQNDLNKYNQDYASAEPPEGGSRVPDNDYQVEVTVCKIKPTEFDRNILNICWELRVLTGDYVGKNIKKWSLIERDRMPYIKKEFETCGLNLARFGDLEGHLNELIGLRLQITVKSKAKKSGDGVYTNVYFNSLLQGKGEVKDNGHAEYSEYDDVPF